MSFLVSARRWLGASAHRGFWLRHALLVPTLLALCGLWLHLSGWDERISALWFDAAANQFPAQNSRLLELVGHKLAKSAALVLWFVLLVAAVAARWRAALRPHRQVLWLTVLAMALGPTVVVVLKDINSMPCPWSLTQFGGDLAPRFDWFVSRAQAGRCFPGGHAAGGFSLVALFFAARLMGRPSWARWALLATVVLGVVFSWVRVVQGAHFVSHNLWAAAVDWWAAALVFAPALLASPATSATASSSNKESA